MRFACIAAAAGFGLAAGLAHSQAPYEPKPASPPPDAGYVLVDGTIQIVGWDDLAGIFDRLNALYERTHPGTKLKYVTGNLIAPQHALIFGETAFAPTGMEFSSSLNSAYRPQVKAPWQNLLPTEGRPVEPSPRHWPSPILQTSRHAERNPRLRATDRA